MALSTARERLLTRLLTEFGEALPGRDDSLREIAARAGTSHALLRYHFGSHAGVLNAMLIAQRAQDNIALAAEATDATFAQLVRGIWARYAAPEGLDRIRSFFLVAGMAAQDPRGFEEFISTLDDLVALLVTVARREGDSKERAEVRAMVTIAALRGLLLQEVLNPGSLREDALELVLTLSP